MPILRTVQTPESFTPPDDHPAERVSGTVARRGGEGFWALGERLAWLAALVLSISAFTGWYAGSGDGLSLSVTGWNTGPLGKLVFFIGLAVIALVALREAGIDLPATIPESLIVIALGSLATIFVLIRLISIPEQFLPVDGRGIGIWISLVAALALIAAGLLQASEEL